MSVQIVVDNTSNHKLHLSNHHHKKELECDARRKYSVNLPLSVNHQTLYKLKKRDCVLADIWIDHTGLITDVKNLTKHFSVSFSNKHHAQRSMIHGYGRTGLDVGDWIDGYLNAVYSTGELQIILIKDVCC